MKEDSALVIVDVQNDFCPGGALAVEGGDDIIPIINEYIRLLRRNGTWIIASRDWHPRVSKHFKEFGGIWPVHCVQGSDGARFRTGLDLPQEALVVSKGMDPERDDYSALHARDDAGTPLPELLKRNGVRHLYVCGLATDYCVLQTTLEGLRKGFGVTVLTDAISGVDLQAGDSVRALAEMKAAGSIFATLKDLQQNQ